jgi:flagellar basal body L-ring protein FlgH
MIMGILTYDILTLRMTQEDEQSKEQASFASKQNATEQRTKIKMGKATENENCEHSKTMRMTNGKRATTLLFSKTW